jgi:hypothetical protein
MNQSTYRGLPALSNPVPSLPLHFRSVPERQINGREFRGCKFATAANDQLLAMRPSHNLTTGASTSIKRTAILSRSAMTARHMKGLP